MNARRGWWLIFVALLVAGAATTEAGELRLTWEPPTQPPTPTGYRVFTGLDAGNMGPVDIGLVLSHDFASLPDCATNNFGVKALAGTAESQMSLVLSVYPRPSITDVTSDGTGTHTIIGNNFDPNIKVYVDSGAGFVQLPSGDVQRTSCTQIDIPAVALFRVQVANVALPLGHGEPLNIFSLPWPGPVNVTVE
jgi:hypothetical protein